MKRIPGLLIIFFSFIFFTSSTAFAITPIIPLKVEVGADSQLEYSQSSLGSFYSKYGIKRGKAGEGLKIGIIDSGIAVYPKKYSNFKTNPCFDDTGYAKIKQLGDKRYTNNKVFVARVFASKPIEITKGFSIGTSATPEAMNPHGSHVAGIIACNYGVKANLNGSEIGTISGILPRALLGSYNVFPGTGGGGLPKYIAEAVDQAVKDKMDILNLSLGGEIGFDEGLVVAAVERAIKAGVVVVVAAGNEGPSGSTIGSPGVVKDAITVGSVTGGRNIINTLRVDGLEFKGTVGNIGLPKKRVSGLLVNASGGDEFINGCDLDSISDEVAGNIALVMRGDCYFIDKIENLRSKGAVGVVVVSNEGKKVVSISSPYDQNYDIATILVPYEDLTILKEKFGEKAVFDIPTLIKNNLDELNRVSSFSSRGLAQLNSEVYYKPDILAPGENIISAGTSTSVFESCAVNGGCFLSMSGTSMATPYIVGVVGLLKSKFKNLTPLEIKSILIHGGVLEGYYNELLEYASGYGLVDVSNSYSSDFLIREDYLDLNKGDSFTLKNLSSKELSITITKGEGARENLVFTPLVVILKPFEERRISLGLGKVIDEGFHPFKLFSKSVNLNLISYKNGVL